MSTYVPAGFALLPLLRTVSAGTAIVVSNCGPDTPVYFASISGSHSALAPLPAGGYSEPFSQDGVGVSIKMSPEPNGAVTQFEYTWTQSDGKVAYDISNIDGNPFAQQGMSLVPSEAGTEGSPSCVTVDCPAGQASCDAAYNLPDDVRTKVCPATSDLTFILCPGGAPAAGPGPGASSGAASGVPSSAAAVPAQTQAPTADSAIPQAQNSISPPVTEQVAQAQQTQTSPATTQAGRGRQHRRAGHAEPRVG